MVSGTDYERILAGLPVISLMGQALGGKTTFGIGGPADAWVEPADAETLAELVKRLREAGCPWMVLGSGSNVLVRDGGFNGVVIHMGRGLSRAEFRGPQVTVGAGLHLAALLGLMGQKGMGGMEWSAGIPGTVGGAVATNAGAHGRCFGDSVRDVYVVSSDGRREQLNPTELEFGYRRSGVPPASVVTGVRLELECRAPARENAS